MALTKITSKMTDDTIPQKTAHGAMKLPVGATGQRPTGEAGDLRYNSTTGEFEGYTTEWKPLGLDKAPTPTLSSSAESEITVTNHSIYNSPTYRVKSGTEELPFTISGDTITITGVTATGGSQTLSVEVDDFGDFSQQAPSDAETIAVILPQGFRYYKLKGFARSGSGDPYVQEFILYSQANGVSPYTFPDSAYTAPYNYGSYYPYKVKNVSSGWWMLSSPTAIYLTPTLRYFPSDALTIDAGSLILVKSFKLRFYNNYYSNSVTLQGSNDNINWTTINTLTGITGYSTNTVNI
jgi:hypothetical protein